MGTETLLERLSASAVAASGRNGTGDAVRSAINIEGLRDLGFEIADGQGGDPVEWAAQILAIASAMPWLPDPVPVVELLDEAEALMRSHPARFAAAAHVARGREGGRWVAEIVDALLATREPTPVVTPGDEDRAAAILARALSGMDPRVVRDAEEAVSDRLEWEFGVHALRRQTGTAWSAQASGGHADEQIRLRGDLVLSRYGGAVFVEWHGAGEPTLTFGSDAGRVEAPRVASPGCQVAWALSDPRVMEAEFANGADVFRVKLPR